MSTAMPYHSGHAPPAAGDTPLDWLVLVAPLVVCAAYLVMVVRQERRGRPWPKRRVVLFTAGAGLIALALSPPLMALAHQDLRWHMAQHLAIGMVAPLGLVLAAPLTILLRSVPVGAGRFIARTLRRRPVHLLAHPVTALVLSIGGMYALYLTPLFAWSLERSALHWLVLVHFLAAGYLFTWTIAGPDAAPGRPGITTRAAVLILSLGLHAALGKLMYAHLLPRGVPYDADQVRDAAVLMYYGGDIAELLLAIALFNGWYQQRLRRRLRATSTASPAPCSLNRRRPVARDVPGTGMAPSTATAATTPSSFTRSRHRDGHVVS